MLLALCAASACGAKKHPPPAAGGEEPIRNGLGGSGDRLDNGGSGGEGGAAGSGSMAGSAGGLNTSGSAGSGPIEPGCIPREDCRTFCAAFGNDPASCGLGNTAQCGCICEQRFHGPCPEQLGALLSCVGSTPRVDCANHGRIFTGCEQPSFELELCDFRAREELCAQSYPRCLPYCEAAVLGYCPLGTDSVTSCLCGCEASLIGRCESQFNTFMDCSADAPVFTCDGNGRELSSGCLSEWQALDSCVRGTTPDAGN